MRSLYIVRHGIAVPHGTEGVEENARPLTNKGIRRTRRIGRGLNRLRVRPDRIYTSPLPRARQTAEILASSLHLSQYVELSDELLPDRDAASILSWARGLPHKRVMLVGHNPSLQDLVGLLLVGQTEPAVRLGEFRKGGVAAFRADESGVLQLDWFAPPRLLRRLGV